LRFDVEIIVDMTCRMIDKFDKCWSEMNGLLAIALILYPRNKLNCVDFYFKEIYKSQASGKIQRITSLSYDLLVEYVVEKLKFQLLRILLFLLKLPLVTQLFSQKDLLKKIDRYAAHRTIRELRKGRST